MHSQYGTIMHSFDDWDAVVAHVRAAKPIWYKPPLDRYASEVRAKVKRIGPNAWIRVYPPGTDCDPFTADSGHLDRFLHVKQFGGG